MGRTFRPTHDRHPCWGDGHFTYMEGEKLMAHPRWPGFNSKTGNPLADNSARRMNQKMYRRMKTQFRLVNLVGRKRKKYLMRVEGGRYLELWAALMNQVAHERRAAK